MIPWAEIVKGLVQGLGKLLSKRKPPVDLPPPITDADLEETPTEPHRKPPPKVT